MRINQDDLQSLRRECGVCSSVLLGNDLYIIKDGIIVGDCCLFFCEGCDDVFDDKNDIVTCNGCGSGLCHEWCGEFCECDKKQCGECGCEVCLRECINEIFIPDLGGIVMGWV